jgi:nucleotide-binding universal stress UspA family protein
VEVIMPDIHRILVPVDFSAGSRAAVDYAALLASRLGASIDLFHVWTPPALVPDNLLVIAPDQKGGGITLEDLARNRAAVEMKELQGILRQRGIQTVQPHVGVGAPAHEILAFASHARHDLIVMGTHGRIGVAHFLIGSVAEKVVRSAPCPVLTVRKEEAK